MNKYIVNGLKIIEIRNYTQQIRKLLKLSNNNCINIVKLLDKITILFLDYGLNFNYIIRNDSDPIFQDNEEAFTDMKTGIIYFKESVIQNACKKRYHRSSFTIAHELGHYFLHYLQSDVKFCLVSDNIDIPAYKNPEWQADVFASELLMPFEQCKILSVEDIRKKFHVSRKAAETRKNKITKETEKKRNFNKCCASRTI